MSARAGQGVVWGRGWLDCRTAYSFSNLASQLALHVSVLFLKKTFLLKKAKQKKTKAAKTNNSELLTLNSWCDENNIALKSFSLDFDPPLPFWTVSSLFLGLMFLSGNEGVERNELLFSSFDVICCH